MDMKTYLKQATKTERAALAEAVGSSVGYLYLIGGGHRRPGAKLCKALVEAEPKLALHDLRPDIWSPPIEGRRAGDSVPSAPDRPYRRVPTRKNVAELRRARPRIRDSVPKPRSLGKK